MGRGEELSMSALGSLLALSLAACIAASPASAQSSVDTWTSFAAPMAYQVFELPFAVDSAHVGHHLEFRVWYERKAYINVDWVARI